MQDEIILAAKLMIDEVYFFRKCSYYAISEDCGLVFKESALRQCYSIVHLKNGSLQLFS